MPMKYNHCSRHELFRVRLELYFCNHLVPKCGHNTYQLVTCLDSYIYISADSLSDEIWFMISCPTPTNSQVTVWELKATLVFTSNQDCFAYCFAHRALLGSASASSSPHIGISLWLCSPWVHHVKEDSNALICTKWLQKYNKVSLLISPASYIKSRRAMTKNSPLSVQYVQLGDLCLTYYLRVFTDVSLVSLNCAKATQGKEIFQEWPLNS